MWRDRDPVVGGVLRKTELAHAEGEHRWVRASQVQLPLIDLAQVQQQLGFDAVGFPHELARRREKVRAAHGLERDTCISSCGPSWHRPLTSPPPCTIPDADAT